MSKRINVTFRFDIDDDATPEQIDTLMYAAMVQFEDPRDEEGDRVDFATWNVDGEWEEV